MEERKQKITEENKRVEKRVKRIKKQLKWSLCNGRPVCVVSRPVCVIADRSTQKRSPILALWTSLSGPTGLRVAYRNTHKKNTTITDQSAKQQTGLRLRSFRCVFVRYVQTGWVMQTSLKRGRGGGATNLFADRSAVVYTGLLAMQTGLWQPTLGVLPLLTNGHGHLLQFVLDHRSMLAFATFGCSLTFQRRSRCPCA